MSFEDAAIKQIRNALFFFFAVLVRGVISVPLAFMVNWLWNLSVPHIFGLPVIGWLDALALLILTDILLGSHKEP